MSWQGVFQPRDTHVVVRQHNLTSESSFDVGHELKPGDLPVFHMRSLFWRKVIGKKDSPWVNEMLEKAMPVKKAAKKDDPKVEKKPRKPRKKVDKGIG